MKRLLQFCKSIGLKPRCLGLSILSVVLMLQPACNTTGGNLGPAAQLTAQYAVSKYLSQAKTYDAWNKRHAQLEQANNAIAALNEQGISASALQAIVAKYSGNPDVAFAVSLALLYAPAGSVAGAPNNAAIKSLTDGIKTALLTPSPYPTPDFHPVNPAA